MAQKWGRGEKSAKGLNVKSLLHRHKFWSSKACANKPQFFWCLHCGCFLLFLIVILMHLNKLLSVVQPIRRLQMPAAKEMNKRGFLLQASIPFSPLWLFPSLPPSPSPFDVHHTCSLTSEDVVISILRSLGQSRCTLQAEVTFSAYLLVSEKYPLLTTVHSHPEIWTN